MHLFKGQDPPSRLPNEAHPKSKKSCLSALTICLEETERESRGLRLLTRKVENLPLSSDKIYFRAAPRAATLLRSPSIQV